MVTWAQAIPTASYILVAAWAARHLIAYRERRKVAVHVHSLR